MNQRHHHAKADEFTFYLAEKQTKNQYQINLTLKHMQQ